MRFAAGRWIISDAIAGTTGLWIAEQESALRELNTMASNPQTPGGGHYEWHDDFRPAADGIDSSAVERLDHQFARISGAAGRKRSS